MKKYLKHSVYLAILLSSISAGAVYAKINVPGEHYDKFVSFDKVHKVSMKNQVYYFDKGVEFSGGIFHDPLDGYNRGKNYGSLYLEPNTSAIINIGKAEEREYDGNFAGEVSALELKDGASLTINAKDEKLNFENKKIDYEKFDQGANYDKPIVYGMLVNKDVNLNINAQSMHVKIDRTLLGKVTNHPNTRMYAIKIGSGSNVNIDLNNGDFELDAIDVLTGPYKYEFDGICIFNEKEKDTNFSLNAKNIKLAKKSDRWTMGTAIGIYGENGENSKSEFKFHAEKDFSIARFWYGLSVRDNNKINIDAKKISISAIASGIEFDNNADIKLGTLKNTKSIDIVADTAFEGFGKGSVNLAAQNVNLIGAGRDFDQNDRDFIWLNGGGSLTVKANNINILPMKGVEHYSYGATDITLYDSSLKLEANKINMYGGSTDVLRNSNYEVVAKELEIIENNGIRVEESNYSLKAETINVTSNKYGIWRCGDPHNDKNSSIYLEANKLTVNAYNSIFSANKNGNVNVKVNEAVLGGCITVYDGGKLSIASRDEGVDGWISINCAKKNQAVLEAESMDSTNKSQIDFKQSSIINGLKKVDGQLVTEYKNKPGSSAGIAIRAEGNAEVNLNEGKAYAIYGDIIVDKEKEWDDEGYTFSEKSGVVNIGGIGSIVCGDVLAVNDGKVNINLVNGSIEGRLDSYDDFGTDVHDVRPGEFRDDLLKDGGHINLTLDKSTWKAHHKSWVSELNLKDGIVDLASDESASVAIKKLTGNGRFDVKLNSVDHSKSNMIYIGDGSGNHKINIVGGITGGYENITEDNPLRFATVMNSTGKFELVDASTVDGGIYDLKYVAAKEDYDKDDPENEKYNSNQVASDEFVDKVIDGSDAAVNWIITGVKEKEESKAANAIIDMSRANYRNAVYMDRLNKRLGEARYLDGNDGIWVRMRHDRIGVQDEFRSSNTMYQVGYDKLYKSSDTGERHAGVAIDYLDGSTSYTKVGGEGDSKRYGLWMYDTWFGDKGHYTDYVVKYGHMKNDFDITAMTTGEQITGDYNNNMFSASAEYGRKHEFGDDWYVEPQVQLQFARITGADYATTQGTDVSVDAVNSLIARAGFRLGKDIGERSNIYIKADIMHEFLGDQDIVARDNTGTMDRTFENKGTWYDLGFGFTTALSDNSYAYLDVEQSFGNDNEDTYEINVGMKWAF